MKTTNFEISKKLKEIGFKAKTDKCWAKIRNSKLDEFSIRTLDFSIPANCDEWYPSYDLETLIDALPETVEIINSNFTGKRIFYLDSNIRGNEISLEINEGESLADTAGRLLIKLHEAGIINFKK